MRSKPFLLLALLAALPALAQEPGVPAAASGSPFIQMRRHGPGQLAAVPGTLGEEFGDWSGYEVTGSNFTDVRGSWIVPNLTCPFTPTYSANFVGIGDFPETIKIGTEADCGFSFPTYYAWFEFPNKPAREFSSMTISPGDNMSATVSYDGSQFTLKMTDHTTSKTVNVSKTISVKRNSADWITEAITNDIIGALPLADFGKVSWGEDYTGDHQTNWATDSTISGPISDFGSSVVEWIMITPLNVVKAKPTALSTDGSSFKVIWKHQ